MLSKNLYILIAISSINYFYFYLRQGIIEK